MPIPTQFYQGYPIKFVEGGAAYTANVTYSISNNAAGDHFLCGHNTDYMHADQTTGDGYSFLLNGWDGPGYGLTFVLDKTSDGTETSRTFGKTPNIFGPYDPLWGTGIHAVLRTTAPNYSTVSTTSGNSYPGVTMPSNNNTEIVFMMDQTEANGGAGQNDFVFIHGASGLSTGRLGCHMYARFNNPGVSTSSASFYNSVGGSGLSLVYLTCTLQYPEWHIGGIKF